MSLGTLEDVLRGCMYFCGTHIPAGKKEYREERLVVITLNQYLMDWRTFYILHCDFQRVLIKKARSSYWPDNLWA